MQKLLIPTLLGLAMFAGQANAAAPLRPPQGYFAPIEAFKTGDFKNDCDAMPTPYTGSLQFRSKYEGSDKARSTLNVQSEKAFRDSTADITKLEKDTSKRTPLDRWALSAANGRATTDKVTTSCNSRAVTRQRVRREPLECRVTVDEVVLERGQGVYHGEDHQRPGSVFVNNPGAVGLIGDGSDQRRHLEQACSW